MSKSLNYISFILILLINCFIQGSTPNSSSSNNNDIPLTTRKRKAVSDLEGQPEVNKRTKEQEEEKTISTSNSSSSSDTDMLLTVKSSDSNIDSWRHWIGPKVIQNIVAQYLYTWEINKTHDFNIPISHILKHDRDNRIAQIVNAPNGKIIACLIRSVPLMIKICDISDINNIKDETFLEKEEIKKIDITNEHLYVLNNDGSFDIFNITNKNKIASIANPFNNVTTTNNKKKCNDDSEDESDSDSDGEEYCCKKSKKRAFDFKIKENNIFVMYLDSILKYDISNLEKIILSTTYTYPRHRGTYKIIFTSSKSYTFCNRKICYLDELKKSAQPLSNIKDLEVVDISKDNKLLAKKEWGKSNDLVNRIYNLDNINDKSLHFYEEITYGNTALKFSPDSKYLACLNCNFDNNNSRLKILDLSDHNKIYSNSESSYPVHFNNSDVRLIFTNYDNVIIVVFYSQLNFVINLGILLQNRISS